MTLLWALALAGPTEFRDEVAALVRIGARPSGSAALVRARAHVGRRYASLGLEARAQPYRGGINLVASHGEGREVVVVGAHLDTVPGTPGADDNASGTAGVLLVARSLRGRVCARRIEFVHFDGEENGMRGSAAYVAGLRRRARPIAAIVFDVIGYHTRNDGRVLVHSGNAPASHTLAPAFVAAAGKRLRPRVLTRGSYWTSDVVRFWEAGLPALYITENFLGDWNRETHTPRDDLSRLNAVYGADIAQAAAGAVARWARCR
jgi:Zn-dependent M28 family amino/carboxypeptidase